MGFVRSGLELGMILYADVEGPVGELDGLDQSAVGREAREGQACFLQHIAVIVIELIAMTVAFGDSEV